MPGYLRKDVTEWLERSLESYYPLVFIDCVHIKIHRERSVDMEAFYVVLAVKETRPGKCSGTSTSPRKVLWGGVRSGMSCKREVSAGWVLYVQMGSGDWRMS